MDIEFTKSSRRYLERMGIVPTERLPRMRLSPGRNEGHRVPATPYVLPIFLQARNGAPSPDRATETGVWPDQP